MRINQEFAIFAVLAGFLTVVGIARTQVSRTPADAANSANAPVIVELFTSEGCSSCPPADALLKQLSENAPIPGVEIIALEEHVDYWDHLGWKDPFSSSEFTSRQNDYARRFGSDGVYTPQMVVDGQTEFVGSRSREAREVIQKAATQPKLTISLIPSPGNEHDKARFDIKIGNFAVLSNDKEAELWIAVTEKNLNTDVKAGENSGERLQHAAVVRSLRKVDTFRGGADYQTHSVVKLDPSWQQANLNFVVFAVEKASHKIIGATSGKISRS